MSAILRLVRGASIAGALGALALRGDGQSASANMGAAATIDLAMTGSAVRDLDFGQLSPAIPQTVAPSDVPGCLLCASGKWTFSNLAGGGAPATRFARLTFTALPSSLAGPGGATLPLAWTNGARACLEKGAAEYHCYSPWTPTQGSTQSHQINGPGAPSTPGGPGARSLNVYLGGTAQPAANQRAGIYVGAVTLQFAYGSS